MLGELGILKTGEWELMDTCRMVGKKSKEHSPIKDKIVYRAQEFTQLHGRRIYREQSQESEIRAKIFSELRCIILSVDEKKFF